MRKAIDNLQYIGDVGETDIQLLKRILPHCTAEQLNHIETSTKVRLRLQIHPFYSPKVLMLLLRFPLECVLSLHAQRCCYVVGLTIATNYCLTVDTDMVQLAMV